MIVAVAKYIMIFVVSQLSANNISSRVALLYYICYLSYTLYNHINSMVLRCSYIIFYFIFQIIN